MIMRGEQRAAAELLVQMLGNVIQQQFGPSRDWPFGSAIAFIGMGVVLLGLWAYARVAGEKGGEVL